MPKAHIDLAVMVPPGSRQTYSTKFDNLGPLGPVTEFGLFASQTYLDKVYREKNVHLNYWRNRKQLIEAQIKIPEWLFKQLQDEVIYKPLWKTKCLSINCVLIITDREQAVDYLRPQIMLEISGNTTDSSSDLILDIRYKQSVNDLVNNMSKDIDAKNSSFFILTSFPNIVTVQSSLSRIFLSVNYTALIDFIEERQSNSDLYCRNCNTYQGMHQFNKLTWNNLAEVSPLLHKLATFMRLSTLDYIQFLRSIIKLENKYSSATRVKILNIKESSANFSLPNIEAFYDIACEWVNDNSDEWTRWTESYNQRRNLTIALLLPTYGKWRTKKLPDVANQALMDYQSSDLDNEYQYVLEPYLSECDDSKGLEDYMQATQEEDGKTLIAVVAALCSDSIASIALMSNLTRRVVVSPTVETAKHKFSYFFRVVPSITGINFAMIYFIKHQNWRRIGIIRKDDLFLKASIFKNCGLEVVEDAEIPENSMSYDIIYSRLKSMKEKQTKIFLVEFFTRGSVNVMCAAYNLGMTLENGYVFFLNPWLPSNWFIDEGITQCTPDQMRIAIMGVFYVAHRVSFPTKLIPEFSSDPIPSLSSYEMYMEDSIHIILSTFEELLKIHPSAASAVTDKDVAEDFRRLMFHNSKNIEFNDANQRIGISWDVRQAYYRDNKSYIEPAIYSFSVPETVRLPPNPDSLIPVDLNEAYEHFSQKLNITKLSPVKWGNSKTPNDGGVRYLCSVGILAEYFNLDCNATIVLLSIACCILPILLAISVCILHYRKKAKIAEKNNKKPFEDLCHELAHIEIPRCDILLNREIGCGAFGRVFGGEAKSNGHWEAVAVKRMSKKSNYEGKMEFLSEAKLMSRIKHRNVVRLVGVGLKGDHLYIVMEFLLYGDLKTFLLSRRCLLQKDETNDIVSPARLTLMAKDIASGVEYLHSNQLIHRDIACRNCLVGEDYTVKIGDFGLTREATLNDRTEAYYRFTRSCQLPIRWMAPEAIELGVFSPKSDMWSFGILLYEIVTFGVFPYSHLCDIEVVERVKRNGFSITEFLPPAAKDTPIWNLIIHLCQHCWQHRPDSMQYVVELFDENPEIVQAYLTEDPPKIINEDIIGSKSLTEINYGKSSITSNFDQIYGYNTVEKLEPNDYFLNSNRLQHQLSESYANNTNMSRNILLDDDDETLLVDKRDHVSFDRKNSTKSCLEQYSSIGHRQKRQNINNSSYFQRVKSTFQLPVKDCYYEYEEYNQENPHSHYYTTHSGQLSAPPPILMSTRNGFLQPKEEEAWITLTNESYPGTSRTPTTIINNSCGNLSTLKRSPHGDHSNEGSRMLCASNARKKVVQRKFFDNATSAIKSLLGVADQQPPQASKSFLAKRYEYSSESQIRRNPTRRQPIPSNEQAYKSLSNQPLLFSTCSGPAINTYSNSSTNSTTIISSDARQTLNSNNATVPCCLSRMCPSSSPNDIGPTPALDGFIQQPSKDSNRPQKDQPMPSISDPDNINRNEPKISFYFVENELDNEILPL